MRIVEARMIQAIKDTINKIDFHGRIMKCGNTEVSQTLPGTVETTDYQRIISVRLHGYEIAAIRPVEGTVWVSDCGWQTNTTKSRLNVLISALTKHGHDSGISQKNGEWLQITPTGAQRKWKGQDVFPLSLDAGNYYLEQAERLTAKPRG
jgi:hypothetical protein